MDPRIKSLFRDEIAADGASRFGVRFEDLTNLGGFQNFIYTYTRDGVPYILRFTPSSLRTPDALEAELEWIRDLAAGGLTVSTPISSEQGMDVERISGGAADFYATSFTFAPGRKLGYPECLRNPELYELLGRFTGRLHELSKRYRPRTRRHTWEHNAYLLRAADYLPPEDEPVLHALEELKSRLRSLPQTPDTFGLIHGDIQIGNYTLDDSGALTLFDFDECQYSWYAEDIAIPLYYLLYVFGDDSASDRQMQYELFVKHFELGYTEDGRELPAGCWEQLPLFLRLREIIVYIGMNRSWDLREPDGWARDFLRESRHRMTHGMSLIDDFL